MMKHFFEFCTVNFFMVVILVFVILGGVKECYEQQHDQKIREMIVKDSLEHLRDGE